MLNIFGAISFQRIYQPKTEKQQSKENWETAVKSR